MRYGIYLFILFLEVLVFEIIFGDEEAAAFSKGIVETIFSKDNVITGVSKSVVATGEYKGVVGAVIPEGVAVTTGA